MDSYGDTSGRIGRDWLDRHDEELEQELLDDELNLDELFGPEQEDAPGELSRRRYFRELFRLQRELVKLQNWVVHTGHKVVILFEGRDAAGKGGVIKRITQRLNPRVCRVAALRDYRGTPEAVLNDPSLMQMLLPVVRADFLVTGSYRYQAHGPLEAALHLFGGREDSLRSAELLGWLHEAGGDFTLDLLDGQHFFIREQQGQLLRLLRRYAGQHLLRWHKDKVRGSMRAAS